MFCTFIIATHSTDSCNNQVNFESDKPQRSEERFLSNSVKFPHSELSQKWGDFDGGAVYNRSIIALRCWMIKEHQKNPSVLCQQGPLLPRNHFLAAPSCGLLQFINFQFMFPNL